MTGDRRRPALAAAALATAAGLAIVIARPQTASHRPELATAPRVQRAPPRPTQPLLALDRRHALVVAERFAAAYAEWDAGHRDRRRSRRLAAITTPALYAALSGPAARPVAQRPRILSLAPMGAYKADRGSFRVALLDRTGRYVMTLVVVPSRDGARVERLQR